MPPSRAVSNARAAKKFQRKQSLAQAKTLGNKFTEKQSRFERRREEELVRATQQQRGTAIAESNEISIGDGLLGNKHAWQRQDGQLSSFSAGSADAPSPFEIASRSKRLVRAVDAKALTTQSSATFGMGSRTPVATGGVLPSLPVSGGTRTTRRVARFNLYDGGRSSIAAVAGSGLGSAMGQQRRTRDSDASGDHSEGIEDLLRSHQEGVGDGGDDGEGTEPSRKLTRAEKFKEVVANSRSHRAQLQRERAERDADATALDEELKDLLHLLPKRSKDAEEREAFARSGTPAVRALLASYKHGHTAKQLTIKSSGEFAVTALTGKSMSVRGEGAGEMQRSVDGASFEDSLDARSKALLERIRKGGAAAVRSTEEVEVAAAVADTDTATGADAHHKASRDAKLAQAEPPINVEDDFDMMLNRMRLDTRRAHAADRLLNDEEEAALVAQQQLLEEDRRAVPELGLVEKDQVQLGRGEWVRKGGDAVYQMDVDGDGVYEDNVDIPSSYEGDSDAGSDAASVDGGAAEGSEKEEEDHGLFAQGDATTGDGDLTAAAEVAAKAVVGSATLDRLLTEVEAIATSGDAVYDSLVESRQASEQRQQHFSNLMLQLHAYARTHVLEVANTFRLVLIEAERSFLRGQRRALSRPMMLSLVVIANLFPMSDYRHEVATPFYIFLCSTLMQMKLDTLDNVHCYVGLCALLTQSVRGADGKFVGEAVTALMNVLALQLPRSEIEPIRYQGLRVPIPIMERGEAPLLAVYAGDTADKKNTAEEESAPKRAQPWRLLETQHDPEQLLLCAYHQLSVLADLYSPIPAFPVFMLYPFMALDALLIKQREKEKEKINAKGVVMHRGPSPAVIAAHAELKALLERYAAAAEAHRAPLAMRTYRPRPIRLFEPLLEEREENAVKTELRVIKKEIREDKKRVMRHLTAEATVHRRAKEREQSITDAEREKRMHQVMGALQQQQHMMNTVDAMMSKAKSKSKKRISGAPKQLSSQGGDGVSEL